MATLLSLPPELLSLILHGKHTSRCAIALWKCGSSLLNLKLASGLEYLHLKDKRLASTSRYPKMISSLKNLRFLHIDRGEYYLLPTSKSLSEELQKIQGHKLETLVLKCAGALLALRLHRPLDDLSPSQIDKSQALEEDYLTVDSDTSEDDDSDDDEFVLSTYERGASFLFDMETIFPRLTTLKVFPHSDEDTFAEKDLAGLPQSLTTLTYPSTLEWYTHSKGLMAMLPRSLRTINGGMSHRNLIEEDESTVEEMQQMLLRVWSNPPPYLTTLDAIAPPARYRTYDLTWLPRTLTSYRFEVYKPGIPLDLIHTIPPNTGPLNFYDLHLDTFPSDASLLFSKLPSQVTVLSVRDPRSFLITPTFLASLPRSLTSLAVSLKKDETADWAGLRQQISDSEENGVSFWPPNLTFISDGIKSPIAEVVNHLPKRLKSLIVRWEDSSDFPAQHLPPALTLLHARFTQEFHISTALPSSISNLLFDAPNSLLDLQTLVRFAPKSLTTLELHNTEGDLSSTIDTLPSTITFLSLHCLAATSMSCVPRSLTNLFVIRFILPSEPRSDFDYFQALPSTIQHIHMGSASTKRRESLPVLSGSSFSTLTQLRNLEVLGIAEFEPDLLRTLPPSLTTLRMGLTHLTAELGAFINPFWRHSFLAIANDNDAIHLASNWLPEEPLTRFAGEELKVCADRISFFHERSRQYPDPRVTFK